jgi:hypothetical protein
MQLKGGQSGLGDEQRSRAAALMEDAAAVAYCSIARHWPAFCGTLSEVKTAANE